MKSVTGAALSDTNYAVIYDLHSHTQASDGLLTPEALVHRAGEMRVGKGRQKKARYRPRLNSYLNTDTALTLCGSVTLLSSRSDTNKI
jgi:hypothetical protein